MYAAGLKEVGQAFQPAGERGFPAPRKSAGDWKVAGTGRLESLPYTTAAFALKALFLPTPARSLCSR